MAKTNLMGMSKAELMDFAKSIGGEGFRGRQLFKWIYQEGVKSFEPMTDISKKFRTELDNAGIIRKLKISQKLLSDDGTIKLLFDLGDGRSIESVLIPEKRRLTICVSCQAGCAMGCKFCATGSMGFKRNLDAGEIVDQILQGSESFGRNINNIVFMGMGEPMMNLNNVLKACDILTDKLGLSFSHKKITISTVGLVRTMKKFVASGHKVGLAISLHSADEEIRKRIIPVAAKNPLSEILKLAKLYAEKTGRRVSFEYLLLGGVTDSIADAKKLVKAIDGIPCKINLIRYNPVEGLPFKKPDESDVQKFNDYLNPRTYAVMIRESRGTDISGACGQLAVLADD